MNEVLNGPGDERPENASMRGTSNKNQPHIEAGSDEFKGIFASDSVDDSADLRPEKLTAGTFILAMVASGLALWIVATYLSPSFEALRGLQAQHQKDIQGLIKANAESREQFREAQREIEAQDKALKSTQEALVQNEAALLEEQKALAAAQGKDADSSEGSSPAISLPVAKKTSEAELNDTKRELNAIYSALEANRSQLNSSLATYWEVARSAAEIRIAADRDQQAVGQIVGAPAKKSTILYQPVLDDFYSQTAKRIRAERWDVLEAKSEAPVATDLNSARELAGKYSRRLTLTQKALLRVQAAIASEQQSLASAQSELLRAEAALKDAVASQSSKGKN